MSPCQLYLTNAPSWIQVGGGVAGGVALTAGGQVTSLEVSLSATASSILGLGES